MNDRDGGEGGLYEPYNLDVGPVDVAAWARAADGEVDLVASDWSSVRPRLIAEHQAIYAAIVAADPGPARENSGHVRF